MVFLEILFREFRLTTIKGGITMAKKTKWAKFVNMNVPQVWFCHNPNIELEFGRAYIVEDEWKLGKYNIVKLIDFPSYFLADAFKITST